MKINRILSTINNVAYGKSWFKREKKNKEHTGGNDIASNQMRTLQENRAGIYVTPIQTTKVQENTISRALDELSKVNFSTNDVIYMQNLGVRLPFKSGKEAVEYLKSSHINVMYAEFSNPSVHACLDTTQSVPSVLINSNYKDLASFSDVLAISEAMFHEAGHAKDGDSENSIQEEIDCLSLNVLAHQYYKETYPDIFKNQKSPLYFEGVNLYDSLFFDFDPDKKALKKRIADKYGFLNASSANHEASKMAEDIKSLQKFTINT